MHLPISTPRDLNRHLNHVQDRLASAYLTVTAWWIAVALVTLIGITPGRAAAAGNPIESAFASSGSYATTTATVTDSSGKVIYNLFYPSNYATLGFPSPIVTWGDGTNATPGMYSSLLAHFASYGFTVIAANLTNTGSGNEIDAAAHYLVAQNSATGSVFQGHLDVTRVAAVGHSQGAGGATRAATNDPSLITTLMTFSLPNTTWVSSNPDCPTKATCMYNPALVTQPTFFISTHGTLDALIASPATERGFYTKVTGHAAMGVIKTSDGKIADHNSIQNAANGGNPGGEFGYATAWLEYQLRGNSAAAGAFSGTQAELPANTNWPGSATK
jgi:pimeloyl-ACP methyl ester carboxylesterase